MISVVVPTLNEEKNIARCLQSLKRQTFKNFEIIVSDGNSTDRTREIAKKFTKKIVVSKKRRISVQRQVGAKISKGEIIAFIDADCIADRNWLMRIERAFRDKDVVAAYGAIQMHDGSALENFVCKGFFDVYLRIAEAVGSHTCVGSNIAFRRSAFIEVGGFNTALITAEDIDIMHRVKLLGKIRYLPRAVVKVSGRRMKKWGFARFFTYHLTNLLKYQATGKGHAKYEVVR